MMSSVKYLTQQQISRQKLKQAIQEMEKLSGMQKSLLETEHKQRKMLDTSPSIDYVMSLTPGGMRDGRDNVLKLMEVL